MALNDCIRKMKGLVSKADIASLKEYIADGLSDEEAVRKLTLESEYNVVVITKRAAEAGAAITDRPDFLAEIRNIQEARAGKIQVERVKLEDELRELNAEYGDNTVVIDKVRQQHNANNVAKVTDGTADALDIYDEQQLNTVLSSMLFDPNMREGLQKGVLGLKGKTPLELVESFKTLRDRQREIRERIREILVLDNEAVAQLGEIDVRKAETLFQKERGSITFDEMRRGLIRLTETHNLSTFLHEAGHLYLETMRSISEGDGVPQEVRDDWQKILNYLGVTEGRQITGKHHEKWARSFETYLMEGKAPSVELQDAFNAFKRWLELIYSKLRDLAGIELSDEIRGVFDRILASEAQIAQAEAVQEYAAIFSTAEEAGWSQEVFEVYRDSAQRAHQDAVEVETKRMLAAMNREQERWWNIEKDKVREEVTAEVHSAKLYIALSMLQRGTQPDGSPTRMAPFKIDKKSLLALLQGSQITLNNFPRPFIYTVKGGVDVDTAAQIFGYSSGHQMIQEIARAPKMEKKNLLESRIIGETEARMRERFPDPMLDGTLADEAVRAVHSDRRASVLAAEMRALRKRARADAEIVRATRQTMSRTDRETREANRGQLPKKLEVAQIKAGASLAIGKKQIRNVQPHVYLNAERKAGRQAFEAAAKKDYQTAYDQKRKQIVNHEMYRAAVKAKNQSEATQRYLQKFERKRVQQRLGRSGMLDKILAVIEGVNFRRISLKQVDREKAFDEMMQAIEDGRLIASPAILAKLKARGTNWQDLTVEEFRGMRDIVKQLEHLAKAEVASIINGEEVIFTDAEDDIVNSMLEMNKVIPFQQGQKTAAQERKEGRRRIRHHTLSTGSIVRILDDGHWGALTRRLVIPIRRAYVEKLIPAFHKQQEDIIAIYKKHYSMSELGDFSKKKPIPNTRQELSRSDILSMGMHMGSDSNQKAFFGGILKDGRGKAIGPAYPEQDVRAALATLDARDWAFIQDMWDYLNTYWPAASEAELRRRGIVPQKIEAQPFTVTTSDGQTISLKGGYMRLYYTGKRARADEIDEMAKMLGNGFFVSVTTRAGSTHERVENHGRIVRLGLGAIDQHLREVIRDINIGDEAKFIARLLNSDKVYSAFDRTGNEVALDELKLWLTDAAVGELPAQNKMEQLAAYTRVGFTKSKLAFSTTVTLLQLTGVFQSMGLVGTKAYGQGFGKFMQDPVGHYKRVMETSTYMHTRYGTMQSFSVEAADAKALMRNTFGPVPTRLKMGFERFSHYYFWTIAKMQSLVDVTTWMGAYWKAKNIEGILNEQEAIFYADNIVEGAQTSGIFSDRSGFERGTLGSRTRQSQGIRLWATLISYMIRKQGLFYEKTQKFQKDKTIGNAVNVVSGLMLFFVVEGIASALIYGRLPTGDDDEFELEDLVSWSSARWLAEATADSYISGIPFAREWTSARYGSGNTPIGSLATDAYKLGVQAAQLEADVAALKSFNKVVGTVLHLPSSTANKIIDAYIEDDPEMWEYFIGVRDE